MLLTKSAELKRYVRLNTSDVELPEVVELEVSRLQEQLLRPLLGEGLIFWLEGEYQAGPAADSLAGQLLARVQAVLARLGLAGSLHELQVSVSNTGLQIVSTETHKTAFQHQVVALRDTLERKGWLDMNALLGWLEEHRADSAELVAWAAGPGQLQRRQLLTSAEEFSRFENIQDSWPVFQALRPLIGRQELFVLEPQLGYAFLQELRTQVRTRALTPENEQLLEQFIRPALASLALARAVPELGLRLTGNGIELAIARVDDSNSKEADAGLDQLLQARAYECQRAADILLERMRKHLNAAASAERYPTYFAGPAYVSPSTPKVPLNTAESRIYRFI
ncbi:DUF6712 family protein [Hymenobacter sp. B81]|uniref:DUF6712 family protein n=1 Tax=Hymenobacter sp. B81 TaxID=3344878 RepID=UPI0037DCC661